MPTTHKACKQSWRDETIAACVEHNVCAEKAWAHGGLCTGFDSEGQLARALDAAEVLRS